MRAFGLVTAGVTILSVTALLAADAQDLSQDRIDDIIQEVRGQGSCLRPGPQKTIPISRPRGVQTLDPGGASTGKWETVSDITFSPVDGKRMEHVTYSPVSTLTEVQLTPEDMEDLKSVQPFVLTTNELPKYLIRYLGRQKVDEIGCYVFAVKPKKMEPGLRYFEGEVWVDDRDLQIVKSYGRGVGKLHRNEDQQFPKFENLSRADRWCALVPHLHHRQRHAALQG